MPSRFTFAGLMRICRIGILGRVAPSAGIGSIGSIAIGDARQLRRTGPAHAEEFKEIHAAPTLCAHRRAECVGESAAARAGESAAGMPVKPGPPCRPA